MVALVASILACEDKQIKAVDTGISRDSAITILTEGAKTSGTADTFPNIHRRSRYILAGKEMEVLWFTPTGKVPGKDTLPFRELTPIVVFDGKVIGKGWDFWDSTAKANRIAVPPKDSGQ
jgi:hypothetical protein